MLRSRSLQSRLKPPLMQAGRLVRIALKFWLRCAPLLRISCWLCGVGCGLSTVVSWLILYNSASRVSSSADRFNSNIFVASVRRRVLLFIRSVTTARRSSLVLIAVLFNRTSSGGHSVGDISNEGRRGYYQRGATASDAPACGRAAIRPDLGHGRL